MDWKLIAVIAACAGVAALAGAINKGKGRRGTFVRRALVTKNEQGMYWRLREYADIAGLTVLAQVSFGALLNAKGGASRYRFSQKIADFVLTDKSFKVVAIIELDDSSHNGKESQDENRDSMLKEAGYRVIRYKRTPDLSQLKKDIDAEGVAGQVESVQAKHPPFTPPLPQSTDMGSSKGN